MRGQLCSTGSWYPVSRLVAITKRARRLVRASPFTCGLWGVEAVGITSSVLAAFRTRVAAASRLHQAQRCATTAIYLAFGLDPLEDILRRAVVSFFSWASTVPLQGTCPGLGHNLSGCYEQGHICMEPCYGTYWLPHRAASIHRMASKVAIPMV